jgi:hypothetical protein
MKVIQAAAVLVLIAIAIAIFGVTVINAKPSKPAATVPASNSIDVMRMMIDAKDLPNQQYDAH